MKYLFGAGTTESIILIVLLVVMVGVLIILPLFTNKKRAKQVQELYNSIAVGDVIKTAGGVIGKVTEVRETSPIDKEIVLETGLEGSKTTIIFDIQAVYQVLSKNGVPVSQAPELKEDPQDNEEKSQVTEEVKTEEETVATVKEEPVEAVAAEVEVKAEMKEEKTETVKKKTTKK